MSSYARPISITFLILVAVAFAVDAVHREVVDGEPSLRGLVHAAVGAMFALTLCYREHLRVAHYFATSAIATVAIIRASSSSPYASAWIALGVEVAFTRPVLHGASVLATIAGALSVNAMTYEAIIYCFHLAFVAALGSMRDERRHLFGSLALLFALREQSALWLLAGMRALGGGGVAGMQSNGIEQERVVMSRWQTSTTVAYGLVLFWDARRQPGGFTVSSTRVVHVAVVVATLLHVLPPLLARLPRLAFLVLAFPCLDATLCATRGGDLVLIARGVAAAFVAASVSGLACSPPCRVEASRCRETDAPCLFIVRRAALWLYASLHVARVLLEVDSQLATAIAFHNLVVTFGLAWMALERRDGLSRRVGLVLVAFECVSCASHLASSVDLVAAWKGRLVITRQDLRAVEPPLMLADFLTSIVLTTTLAWQNDAHMTHANGLLHVETSCDNARCNCLCPL